MILKNVGIGFYDPIPEDNNFDLIYEKEYHYVQLIRFVKKL